MKSFRFKIIILFVIFAFGCVKTMAQQGVETLHTRTVWNTNALGTPALEEGLAGSCLGVQNHWVLWAGGSAFPNGKPWEEGKKVFSKEVFVFGTGKDGWELVHRSEFLPLGLSDAAYVSTSQGLLCIGGQTSEGITSECFVLSFDGEKLSRTDYPSLPIAVKSAGAAVIGKKIYVLGGQLASGKSVNAFWELNTEELSQGWKALTPYPLPVSAVALVAQQNGQGISLFAFGGRHLAPNDSLTHFFSDVFSYAPNKGIWERKASLPHPEGGNLPLAAACGVAEGASSVLILGGDSGETYNQVENAIKNHNIPLRNQLWQEHSGFHKDLFIYNTITNEWFIKKNEGLPVAVAAATKLGEQNLLVAGGEQKPGVRSPFISEISFVKNAHFGWMNYLVLAAYFVGMLLLGFLFMKNNNNTEDYFKASGRIPWWAAGISIFATTLSAITFISIPAKSFATDWRMLMFNMTILLAVPFIIRYFLPFFLRFNLDTAYQYLEKRFNRNLRWLASSLFLFFMVSRIAIVLFLPSLALNAVTGFSVYYSILIMSVVTIIYSTSGGMEAVIWGDVIQGFILIAGALAAFFFMISGIDGGLGEFWNTTVEFHKMKTFDFRWDFTEPVFWVVILGGFANTIISYTSDQSVVQRYMTTQNEKATAKSIWLNGIVSVPVSILFFLLGTGLFAFYKANPAQMSVTNPNIDSVFPQFIVSQMPVGFAGLLIAAIFAAAMSTLSSNINSAAAVITSDFYRTLFANSSFKKDMRVAQLSGLVVGLLGTAMALVLATWNIASLWDQFNTFLGLLTSGLGALFILGIFFPRVGSLSAFVGVAGGILTLYIVKLYTPLSFLLYGFIGMVASICIAYLLSLFFPNQKEIKGLTWFSQKRKNTQQ